MSQSSVVDRSDAVDGRTHTLAGILTSQAAGLIMAVAVIAVFVIFLGKGPLYPVQLIGSPAIGPKALDGINIPAVLAGLVLHQGVALAWGLVFTALAFAIGGARTVGTALALGLGIGVASELLDVFLIIPAVMTKVHGSNVWAQNVPAFWDWAAHLIFGASFALFPSMVRRLSGSGAKEVRVEARRTAAAV
jgi:hypothetical protein